MSTAKVARLEVKGLKHGLVRGLERVEFVALLLFGMSIIVWRGHETRGSNGLRHGGRPIVVVG